MSYLLDTCVLSEFQKAEPKRTVIQWLQAQREDLLFLSVLTLGEVRRGVSRLPRSRRRDALERWLDSDLRFRFEGRILAIDSEVALKWGELAKSESVGTPLPTVDGLMASTALVHGLKVATRNEGDFVPTGVGVVNPWKVVSET